MADARVDGDDQCIVCGQYRDEHTGVKHQFSLEGDDPTRKPDRKTAPATAQSPVDLAGISLRLVAVLAGKGILDANDVEAVLRGKVESARPD